MGTTPPSRSSSQSALSVGLRAALALFLLVGVAWPVTAQEQEGEFLCHGRVTDANELPVTGYRVVYLTVGGTDVSISPPTDDNGVYRVSLPEGVACAPVAVISPQGTRIEIEDRTPVSGAAEALRDIRLPIAIAGRFDEGPVGSERLFLAFVEDTARGNRYRWEGRLSYEDFDSENVLLGRAIAAISVPNWSDVEFGARLGIGGVNRSGPLTDDGGMTDVELWGKLRIDPYWNIRTQLAVGAIVTLPTGDEDAGLSFDAVRSKIFGAIRVPFRVLSLAVHAGVRLNEDGEFLGTQLSGETAAAVGVGVVVPWNSSLAFIGEVVYAGERIKGGEPDSRALVGVNWRPLRRGTFRLAVTVGIDDGAPDAGLWVGFSREF